MATTIPSLLPWHSHQPPEEHEDPLSLQAPRIVLNTRNISLFSKRSQDWEKDHTLGHGQAAGPREDGRGHDSHRKTQIASFLWFYFGSKPVLDATCEHQFRATVPRERPQRSGCPRTWIPRVHSKLTQLLEVSCSILPSQSTKTEAGETRVSVINSCGSWVCNLYNRFQALCEKKFSWLQQVCSRFSHMEPWTLPSTPCHKTHPTFCLHASNKQSPVQTPHWRSEK